MDASFHGNNDIIDFAGWSGPAGDDLMSIATQEISGIQVPQFRNAQEWWDSLGSVPLSRIVFNPWPGTATENDVLRLDDHEDRICELVDGTLVEKTMGYEESLIAAQLTRLVGNFVRARKLGLVSGEAGMMRLLNRRVRIPDVAFVSISRLQDGKIPTKRIPDLAPDLAVEIISDSNTAQEMAIKLREYFQAGTRLVWYIDPRTQTVDVYESPESSKRLGANDTLSGGEVLAGFSVQVREIFDVI